MKPSLVAASIAAICVLFISAWHGNATEGDIAKAEQLLTDTLTAIAKVRDYTGTLVGQERFGDKLLTKTIEYKFSRPFKVYIKYIKPHAGREAIFVSGWNDNKLRVHKGSFPDVTMSLSPLSKRAMEDNHHPITTFGLENMTKISAGNIRKGIRRGEATVKVSDSTLFGEAAWKIAARFPKDGHYATAKKGETLWEIAMRTGQNMFVIMHHNDAYDRPGDVDEGDKVFIPWHYAGRVEFFVSKESLIMRKASSWDHAGRLFESYAYPTLTLNPGLTDKDFDHENEKYGF